MFFKFGIKNISREIIRLEKVRNNMKSTGVVRRVDDLGRIVIPKEIRRTLRIREGEELEIFVDNGGVILKKFSKVADLNDISQKFIDVVSPLVGKTILVTDRDAVIAGSGEFKKNYLNKSISKKIETIILKRNIVVEKVVSSFELIDGIDDKCSYIINPIVSFGDVIGSVIMISSNSDISEFDIIINKMITQFLGKYVEE